MKNGEQPGSVSGEIRLAHFGSCRVDLVSVVHRVAPRGTTERQILGIPQTGQNNAASDASRPPLDSESYRRLFCQMLPQLGDAGRVTFENQGITVFHNSSLETHRLPHMIEKGRLRKRFLVRVGQLKHRGLTAEVVRSKQNRNASAETTRGTVAVYFTAARVHNTEVAFPIHDFPAQLERSKHLCGSGTLFRSSLQ